MHSRRSFNPYSPGFSIYLRDLFMIRDNIGIASILIHLDFLSIFTNITWILHVKRLQSLFTWIFYLFLTSRELTVRGYKGFNPYSSGFSIYLKGDKPNDLSASLLQSLFIWIFYLFVDQPLIILKLTMLQSLFIWIFYLF